MPTITHHFAAHADSAARDTLIGALIAAGDHFQDAAPGYADIDTLAAHNRNVAARRRGASAD